ncbi:MAG: type II secretion system F family protein [Planctomycetota bacterium]|nr:MAG: type II secretion system F family protein [Planctomycetota bacterium]
MAYRYQAIDSSGKTMTDVIDADSTGEAAELLRERGLFITQIDKADGSALSLRLSSDKDPQSGVKRKDVIFFTQQMAMLIRSGAQIVQALEAIEEQSQRPAWRNMLGIIRLNIEEGQPLSMALGRFPKLFPLAFTNMIAAGEASGDLELAFERLAILTRQQQDIRNRVIGALTYPAVLLLLCFGVVMTLVTFVLPRFSEMFETLEVDLPFITAFMIATSKWSLTNWPYLLGALLVSIMGMYMFTQSPRGQEFCSRSIVRIPLFGKVIRSVVLARICRIWGQLLESKVGLLEAVQLVKQSTTSLDFQELLTQLGQAITDGNSIGPVLKESWLVPSTFAAAIVTGEESGKLSNSLLFVACCLEEENVQVLSSLTRIIEPIMLIFMGILVGTVAVSLFLPMFDMTSATGV